MKQKNHKETQNFYEKPVQKTVLFFIFIFLLFFFLLFYLGVTAVHIVPSL